MEIDTKINILCQMIRKLWGLYDPTHNNIGNKPARNITWCDAGIETTQGICDGNSLLLNVNLLECSGNR